MTENSDISDNDLGGVPSWYAEIFPAGPNDGFYQKFGQHSASFVARSKDQLVITFDNLSDAGYPNYDKEPWAAKFCAKNGWSHLGLFAQGPTWFRHARVNSFMERLAQSGFFAEFKNVTLSGTSMGAFAALTYARLIPNCTVLAFSPQTTLDPKIVPWENRFKKGRAQDWSLPFSDVAGHTDRAQKIYLVYDPFCENDKKHANRIQGDNIERLHAFGVGHKSVVAIRRLNAIKPVMAAGVQGTLTAPMFHKLMRSRKDLYLYKVNMDAALRARGQDARADAFAKAFRQRRRRNMQAQDTQTATPAESLQK